MDKYKQIISEIKKSCEGCESWSGKDCTLVAPDTGCPYTDKQKKVCVYCNPNPYGHGEAIKELITQNFNDKAHIHTFVSGNGLHTHAYPSPQDTNLAKTYSKCCIIKYCPMCGRKLGEQK